MLAYSECPRLARGSVGLPAGLPRLGIILGVWPIPSAAAHSSGCVRGRKGRPPNGPPGRKPRGVFRRGDRRAMAVRALLSKRDTAYCPIERADQQSTVSALRAYIRSCQVTTYRTSASCARYSVFRNLLPSEFLSVVFSAQKKSQGLPQPVLGGKEKAAACTDSRPSVSTSKLDGQRSYASPKSKSSCVNAERYKEVIRCFSCEGSLMAFCYTVLRYCVRRRIFFGARNTAVLCRRFCVFSCAHVKERTQSDGVLWTSSYRRVYAFTVKNALWLRTTIKIAQ